MLWLTKPIDEDEISIAMESPSDIQGLIYIPFKDNVEEAKLSLAKEMRSNGYEIDIAKL